MRRASPAGGNPLQSHAMRWMAATIGMVTLCLASAAFADHDKHTWEFHGGYWVDVQPQAVPTPVKEPALDEAEALLARGEYKPAKKILLDWEKVHKKSPVRDRCILLLAEVFYQEDSRIKSFYYCDELMDEYPSSPLFQAALQKQYDIASAFLNGYRRTFLWFRFLDASDEGVEMMFRIQQRAPGSPLAEKALLQTADYYYNSQDYDLAFDAYTSYIQRYPRNSQIPRIKLRAAFSCLAQFRGVKFDATSLIDARAQLIDIEKQYPDMAQEENLPSIIEQIDSAFAKKILETAKFYEKTHEDKGAVYQYRFLTETYPESPEAAEARLRLRELPATMLVEAPPPPAPGYAPATQPTVGADLH
jgi:outer membrane assembly lipoprotein YfiO